MDFSTCLGDIENRMNQTTSVFAKILETLVKKILYKKVRKGKSKSNLGNR